MSFISNKARLWGIKLSLLQWNHFIYLQMLK